MELPAPRLTLCALLAFITLVAADFQECYIGPGAALRAPSNVVPCEGNGESACCFLGDTCLSGNTCYNYDTGDLYQIGCTDVTYQDQTCPYKCGFNATLSPWTALEYCDDVANVTDTWVCHAPESCGCEWNSTLAADSLLVLQPRGCKDMGTDARVALYAPSTLAPFISLPSTIGGSTGYYSPTTINSTSTWVTTAIANYTPVTITPLTTYGDQPTTPVLILPGQSASPSTVGSAETFVPSSTVAAASSRSSAPSQNNGTTPTDVNTTNSGLSTGAKAGVGVGVGVGVIAIAFATLACCFMLRRHRNNRKKEQQSQQQQQQQQQYPQHLQSPQMQPVPYYTPGDKPNWNPAYPMGQPMPGPYQHLNPGGPFHGPPAMFHEQRHELHHSGGTISPESPPLAASPPIELSAEQRRFEVDSNGDAMPKPSTSPTPRYAENEGGMF